jgi:hypothetical protein
MWSLSRTPRLRVAPVHPAAYAVHPRVVANSPFGRGTHASDRTGAYLDAGATARALRGVVPAQARVRDFIVTLVLEGV